MGAFFVAYYWSNEQQLKLVADSEGQEKKTSVANDESKRWRGGPSSQARIEERVNAAYSLLLEGNTRRANAELLSNRFNTSLRTAHEDIAKAMKLLKEERQADREEMLNVVTANRLALLKKCMRKGSYQVAQQLLKDLGAAAGENDPSTNDALAVPQISISIEPKAED